jgi:predicted SAM-dependent methyltransferase
MRINVGCGQTPTEGWQNYDNSPSLLLAKYSTLFSILNKLGVINQAQQGYISYAEKHKIDWANAVKRIPLPDASVEVIYTSHMLEHLDREEVQRFLREAHRILITNGIIRIAVPDIKIIVDHYLSHQDADLLVKDTHMAVPKPKTLVERLTYFAIGGRNHHWMYDSSSLIKLLNSSGFCDARSLKPGETTILDPGTLNLREREDASLYIEAKKC